MNETIMHNSWSAIAGQILRVGGVVGLIAVIAVAALGFAWHTTLRSIEGRTQHVENMMMRAQENMDAFVVRSGARDAELMRILLAMCVNAATDQASRDRCIGR